MRQRDAILKSKKILKAVERQNGAPLLKKLISTAAMNGRQEFVAEKFRNYS